MGFLSKASWLICKTKAGLEKKMQNLASMDCSLFVYGLRVKNPGIIPLFLKRRKILVEN